jgi:hypothetical protein
MDHKNVKNVVGGGIYNSQVKKLKVMEKEISKETDEFIDKLDHLCWEHGFEIWPTDTINKRNEDGSYPTFTIHNIGSGETVRLIYIDGDGGGK